MKYILFVGENAAGTDDIKMHQAIQKQTLKQLSQQTPVLSLKPMKRGAQWLAGKKNSIRVKFFSPNTPDWWVKKRYPLLFRKYEIHKGWHLYTGHLRRRVYISVPAGKKDTKYLIKKINKSITSANAEIEREGGKSVFSPTYSRCRDKNWRSVSYR